MIPTSDFCLSSALAYLNLAFANAIGVYSICFLSYQLNKLKPLGLLICFDNKNVIIDAGFWNILSQI